MSNYFAKLEFGSIWIRVQESGDVFDPYEDCLLSRTKFQAKIECVLPLRPWGCLRRLV
jgi:hypothetical protein